MTSDRHTLDCQQCGNVIQVLSPSEAQRVAERPYDFVAYCSVCRRAGEWPIGGDYDQ